MRSEGHAGWRTGARAGRLAGGRVILLRAVGVAAALVSGAALGALPLPSEGALPPGDARWQRGVQMLEAREAILTSQVGMAAGTARWRARELYRYLQSAPPAGSQQAEADRARAITVGLRALARERGEARILARELEQARADRAALPPVTEAVVEPAAVEPAAAPTSRGAASRAPLFTAPLAGAAVVAGFGPGREPSSGAWLFRSGLRLRAPAGQVVRAVADGVVVRAGPSPAGGLALVIDHGGGWTSILAGLGATFVTPGARVARGDAVGRVAGAAPLATGTVTLDLWHGRNSTDPAKYLHF